MCEDVKCTEGAKNVYTFYIDNVFKMCIYFFGALCICIYIIEKCCICKERAKGNQSNDKRTVTPKRICEAALKR